jgi:RNA polymerase II subunit A C-terminal domain phosphatase SSU72
MRICVVCASNQNRSMEAHALLLKKGFADVSSYGTNTMIKVPGPTPSQPNTFPFGTTYEQIAQALLKRDDKLYRQNGLIMLLERNAGIKAAPQRFQDRQFIDDDLIVTCEERCFDIVSEDLLQRSSSASSQGMDSWHAYTNGERVLEREGKPVHVVNFDIVDSPEEATVGSRHIWQFVQGIEERSRRRANKPALDLHSAIAQAYEDWFAANGQSDSNAPKTLYSLHYL